MNSASKAVDVRLTIDPQDLNRALLREYHPTNAIEDITIRTENAQYLTVLGARVRYFQLELTAEYVGHRLMQLGTFERIR